MVIAGPGTGKTKTLTARLVQLLQTGRAQPDSVIALTFTNKAAAEMRDRVAAALGGDIQLPRINTFHALAQQFLARENQETLPIIDDATRAQIVRSLKRKHAVKQWTANELGLMISRAKNQLAPPHDPTIATLVNAYNAELAVRDVQDFDDVLLALYTALRTEKVAQNLRPSHLLVDEFQDTNELQYAIVKLLAPHGNVAVIGDPLQSIYGFRGASAAVFDQFARDHPAAKRVTLTINYRSAAPVVQLANAVFPNAPQLQAARPDVGTVRLVETLNEYGEADWIVRNIERQIGGSDMLRGSDHHAAAGNHTFRDFAVLYRTHSIAKTVRKSLENSGIPYQVAGEDSPYMQPEVVTILQALAFIAGTTERPEIEGFTRTQLQTLLAPLCVRMPSSLTTCVTQIVATLAMPVSETLRQFMNSFVRYDDWPITDYLNHIAELAEQAYYDPAAEAVTLLSIHAAKGLEFPVIYVIGVEEGLLPHYHNARPTPQHIAEEKRLFYVATTRARDELYLLHARSRRREPAQPTSFVRDLPPHILKRTTDDNLAAQQQASHRRAQKRAQGSLF